MRNKRYLVPPVLIASLAFPASFAGETIGASPPAAVAASASTPAKTTPTAIGAPCFPGQQQQQQQQGGRQGGRQQQQQQQQQGGRQGGPQQQ
ncbi:hypothetical protein, partial [Streptomyces sp. NPDC059744]|uniref:hypothetical protein n=1 Tax=Streptomyces sp. NPDC059744 TaxID=3346929 RepID=UPI003663F001